MDELMTRLSVLLVFVGFTAMGCVNPPGVGTFDSDAGDVDEWESVDEAVAGDWYYKPMDETVCANGSSAGLGLNVGDDSRDLVVYLSGGGACWDAVSCRHFRFAANLDEDYHSGRMAEEIQPLFDAGLFDRDADVNPWPEGSYAFIPYCTGDLHTGRKETTYGGFGGGKVVRHYGHDNMGYFLDELPGLFPDVERVWLVGISAGGYGASWNFSRFQRAFPDAELHLYADASPWLPVEESRWSDWRDNWDPEIPAGCDRCAGSPEMLADHLARTYPESRFALSVFLRDPVLSAYLGEMPGSVESSVKTFVDEHWSHDNTRAFVAEGREHEALLMLGDGVESTDGDDLAAFLDRWVAGW